MIEEIISIKLDDSMIFELKDIDDNMDEHHHKIYGTGCMVMHIYNII